jgi:hypothetical protein
VHRGPLEGGADLVGLSADSDELRVRFIFNPLQRLAIRIKGEATVSGVPEVEALGYRFRRRTRNYRSCAVIQHVGAGIPAAEPDGSAVWIPCYELLRS